MILVVDASVALKWFFQSRDNEPDCDQALAILSGVDEGRIQLLQPPHFIAEVTAVLAREKPEEAQKGSRYFCERLFWASQPKQSAKT